jgi:outer membrane protein TolC
MTNAKTQTLKFLSALWLVCISVAYHAQQAEPDQLSFGLKEAQDYAVKNNPGLKGVRFDADAAALQTKQLLGIGLPQLNGSVEYQNFLNLPTSIVPGEFIGAPGQDLRLQFGVPQQMTAGLSASQLLFDGSWLVGLEASKSYAKLQQQQVALTERDVRKNVMDSYGLVLIAQEGLGLLEQNRSILLQTLAESSLLLKEGFVEEQTVDQLQLNLNDLDNRIANAQAQVTLTKNLLKFNMGMPLEKNISLTATSNELLMDNTAQILSTTFNPESTLDFQLAKTGLGMQELNLKNERAKVLPNMVAFYSLQTQALRRDFSFQDTSQPWFPVQLWGVRLNVPIFSGGQRYYSNEKAKVNVYKTTETVNAAKEGLSLEYYTAKTEYQNALGNFNLTKSNYQLAQKIQNTTLIKFKEGIASSFDLAQSNSQVLMAQGNYVQAMLALFNAQTKLQKSLNQL